ncbi:MAG: putative Ig domain-containing protein [Woeseia sp.]
MQYSWFPARILVSLLAMSVFAGCGGESGEEDTPDTGSGTANASPTIWGTPSTSVAVGTQYVFSPESEDPDGDVLTFEIDNKPAWASFSTSSGALQGVPQSGDEATYSGIVISVTDGVSVAALPSFSITVNADGSGGGGGTSSSAPTISGKPNNGVVVDTVYAFQPEASDADGDSLSYSIVNKPSWAAFSTTVGRLSGTPGSADLGTTSNIQLSVTDGDYIDALEPFSITVDSTGAGSITVSWTAPTENDDGSPLQDLAGYRIYYGTISGEYNQVPIEVNSSGVTTFLVDNLASGTYYLVMTSVNDANVESVYSGELQFEIS